jgi:hypothetical protein
MCNSLEQHPFMSSQVDRSSQAWPCSLFRVSQGCNQGALPGAQSPLPSSHGYGRVQFLVIVGLRALSPYWLPTKGHSWLLLHSHTLLATLPPSLKSVLQSWKICIWCLCWLLTQSSQNLLDTKGQSGSSIFCSNISWVMAMSLFNEEAVGELPGSSG